MSRGGRFVHHRGQGPGAWGLGFVVDALRTSEWVAIGWFVTAAVLALVRPLPRERRVRVVAGAAVACLAVVATSRLPSSGVSGVFRNLLPSLFVIGAYRLSGVFFVSPQPRIEQFLLDVDQRVLAALGLRDVLARAPRLAIEIVEAAYVAVYPMLPLGAVAAWYVGRNPAVDRFWTTVFLAEACSYIATAWIQTRPPRELEAGVADLGARSFVRRLNEFVLRYGSNQVNTIPSGHAAGAVAVALVLLSLDPLVGLPFGVFAIAILVATVIGRYHFIVDTVAGAIVAFVVWAIVG